MAIPVGPVNGNYKVVGYSLEGGLIKVEFLNANPGGGQYNLWYAYFALSEIPVTGVTQPQLQTALTNRMLLQNNIPALNTAITNGMTINIP